MKSVILLVVLSTCVFAARSQNAESGDANSMTRSSTPSLDASAPMDESSTTKRSRTGHKRASNGTSGGKPNLDGKREHNLDGKREHNLHHSKNHNKTSPATDAGQQTGNKDQVNKMSIGNDAPAIREQLKKKKGKGKGKKSTTAAPA